MQIFLGLAGATISAPAAYSQDSDADDDAIIEEVIVTGMRTSVESALLIKRNSVGVVDAISASDIASFPEENIAEAIQRIPGVQIQKSNGRGSRINVRGLGPEYAAATLNGQNFATTLCRISSGQQSTRLQIPVLYCPESVPNHWLRSQARELQ